MRLDAQQHRYGFKILVIAQGTWYWSEVLCDISFIPKGQRARTVFRSLAPRHNNPSGALGKVLAVTAAILERGEL